MARHSQESLALAAGVHRNTVSLIERGRVPNLATALRIAAALSQDVRAVFPFDFTAPSTGPAGDEGGARSALPQGAPGERSAPGALEPTDSKEQP